MSQTVYLINLKAGRVIHPLGLLYVGSALKRAGYNVKIIHAPFKEIDRWAKEIAAEDPLAVGFSVLTGKHIGFAVEFSRLLKQRNNKIPVVWGGVHPSLLPEQCLKDDFVDIVVVGEGERTIVKLAEAIKNNLDLKRIEGIGFKNQDKKIIINNPSSLISNLDDYQIDWTLIDINQSIYLDHKTNRRVAEFVTSRGCPFNCGFCYNKAFNQRRWRTYSINYVIDNLRFLKQECGVSSVNFCDDNFSVSQERTFQIIESLRQHDITLARLEMRLESLNDILLRRLESLGVRRLFFGLESASDRILKLINKGITRELIIEKFKLLSKYPKIAVNAALIIGYPTEIWEEIQQTIDLGIMISKLVPSAVITFQNYLPFPGTDLYQLAISEGFRPPEESIGWAVFDTFENRRMNLSWLPWADKHTVGLFYKIDKFGKLLTHDSTNRWYRTLGKKVLYLCARARLKNRFFAFPLEIFLLNRFNRYLSSECQN